MDSLAGNDRPQTSQPNSKAGGLPCLVAFMCSRPHHHMSLITGEATIYHHAPASVQQQPSRKIYEATGKH